MVTNNNEKQGFSDRLNAVLDAAGVVKIGKGRQGVLKHLFKVTDKGARKWISGESIPRYEKILKLVETYKYTGVTVEWLLSGNPVLSPFKDDIREYPNHYHVKMMQTTAWRVPLINWVKAGDFTDSAGHYLPNDPELWIGTTTQPKGSTFALKVKGDSMEPLFPDGILIIVEPDLDAQPGDYVIARNGEEATFKQLIRDGNDFYLKPLNNRYPIKPLGEAQIVGIVREAVHKFR